MKLIIADTGPLIHLLGSQTLDLIDQTMTKTFRIAVIAGDGIGPEVIREAIRVADLAAPKSDARCEWTHFPWGTDYYFQNGRMAPADYLDTLAGLEKGVRTNGTADCVA